MRIAIFIKSTTFHKGYGGLETQNKVLAEGLIARGHEVLVFSPQGNFQEKEAVSNGVKYIFIPAVYRMGIFFQGFERFISRVIAKLGKNASGIVSNKGKEDWIEKSYLTCKSYHSEKPFDIVICQSSVGVGIIRKKDELKIKVISISHGTILGEFKTRLKSIDSYKPFLSPKFTLKFFRDTIYVLVNFFTRQREFILHSDKVVAVSNVVKKSLVEETYVPESNVVVIFNGLDPAPFKRPSNKNIVTPVRVIYVGRLVKSKGIFVLLEAIKVIENISVIFVGDGEDAQDLIKRTSELGLDNKVSFKGNVAHELVVEELLASDIFVLPSLRIEGFPMVLVEAMFAGLPIIASAIGGNVDAISDNENGYLVNPADVEDLSKKLNLLVEDSTLRNTMGVKSRLRADKYFSLDTMIDKYEKLIKEVINS